MIGDLVSPAQRLSRLSPNRWEHRLSLLFFVIALLLTLALMCENVNAAPQDNKAETVAPATGLQAPSSGSLPNTSGPAGAAPFTLAHPICQTGFWIKQRVDDRDRDGVIIKSRWVFGCANGRIVYGRKV